MTIKSDSKKEKARKLKTSSLPERPITESIFKDEVILELYNECLKIKRGKGIEEVKIHLQPIEYPIPVDYKTRYLDRLKKENTIKDYELKDDEELSSMNIEDTVEPHLDILPMVSEKDYRNAPKENFTIDCCQRDYVAIVKCDPQKVVKLLKENFEKANQKRKEIAKMNEVKAFFKKEPSLECGELKFGLESGSFIYGEVVDNFMPDGDEYKLLKALMEKINKRLSYEEINKALGSDKNRRSISFIIRNIKRKLGIIRSKEKKKDLFSAHNGYMIVCD